jgi:L-asparaginase II
MTNPILVDVARGPLVESQHAGALAVCDARGGVVIALGDVGRGVFPRSAVKALQALPLIETGAADRYGLTDAEISLACASHLGEPAHVATARGMLEKAGRDEPCLECGAHWPGGEEAAHALAARGEKPSQLHNNCSGKHAGFICTACAEREEPSGYVRPVHKVQRRIRAALEEIAGVAMDERAMAVDGCSIPTYATPLSALARAFARFGSGETFDPTRAAAARRIRAAVAAEPFMVRGTGRFDTVAMGALGERVFVKTGAEGVYCGAVPERGLGVALKCADGRAAEAAMACVIGALLDLDADQRAVIDRARSPVLRNWKGVEVGRLRPSRELEAAMARLSASAR